MKTDFNYPNTCPTIDKNIDGFRDSVKTFVEEFFNEYNPALQNALGNYSTQWYSLVNSKCDEIYSYVESYFEDVRRCNSDMRDEIANTLKEAEDEIEDLEHELKVANERIDELEKEKEILESDLKVEIDELQSKLKEYESVG